MRNTAANTTTTTRRPHALFTLGILLALAAILSLVGAVQSAVPTAVTAQTIIDYDTDDDGYIEVSGHAQLNVIQHDLDANGDPASLGSSSYNNAFPNRDGNAATRMGCPSGACVGYELTADIDLNSYPSWTPIGDNTNHYTGDFKGNGFTVSNMTITGTGTRVGLFGATSSASRIESVGVINATVAGTDYAGALVGGSQGVIVACWSTGSVTATRVVGGLVGWSNNSNAITSSYSHASVTGTASNADHVGGLLGASQGAIVRNSYSIGLVTRTGTSPNVGGLLGSGSANDAPGSYWNTTTSMWTSSAGSQTAVGRTTAQLQNPVGYGASSSDTYYGWNIDLDNADGDNDRATGVDDPWYFGTTSQYPILKYGKNDYDLDNDRLIDISTHAQLNAVRWDVDGNGDPVSGSATAYNTAFPLRVTGAAGRMGCPSAGCNGYELAADIDLDTNGDGSHTSSDEYYNLGAGWDPIGRDTPANQRFATTFKGNGYTIDNMTIARTSSNNNQGLFAAIGNAGRVESLGVTNASVSTGTGNYIGILAGNNYGEIVACYTTGTITSRNFVGGLVGFLASDPGTTATITSSYSTASVTGDSGAANIGGLVGRVYETVGTPGGTSTIINSYSTGAVSPGGGLVGSNNSGSATASYWDTETSGRSSSALGTGQATTALQTPTGYTGIYSAWNANLDGVTGNDNPWDFGTSSQYPALRYGGHALYKQGGGRGSYDADNDGYIDVTTLAQFNAIRYDLGGVGTPTAGAGATAYDAAFPGRDPRTASRMGCPSGACTGYELLASLTFDSDNDNDVDANDHGGAYWNGGAGWTPIGDNSARYTGDFKGNGFTIDRLLIDRRGITGDYYGLFGAISGASRIETLGVTNANVIGRNRVGILVGDNHGAVVACYTAGSVSGDSYVGGLVGSLTGSITTSYSIASASGPSIVGGLVGAKWGAGSITNSYSIGLVRRTGSGTATSIGGLAGSSTAGTGAVTASYYDSTTSGCTTGGSNGCTTSAAGTAQTTSGLQTPTGYTGIYAAWNANLDSVTGNDDPWDFGTATQYPILVYHLTNDYDMDNDGYIDISTLAQLDAVRRDLNGNGDATHADYAAAFPRRATAASERMGCPSGTCTGYELVASLDFDENGDGSITQTGDPTYWDSGNGWNPIGRYTSNFKGNGHTINNLFISRASTSDVGLFSETRGSRIETLGVTNANVRGGANTGILIGDMGGGAVVACYATGRLQGNDQTGGLVGYAANGHSINATYSTAYVIGSRYVGGLVGFGFSGSITNSYSTGRVAPANDSGGFLGYSGTSHSQSNNYYDTSTSGRSGGIGGVSGGSGAGVTGKTTRELQTVIEYTGIYAAWNVDLDNADNDADAATGRDDPWAFGNNMQYPMLDYQSMSLVPQGGQAMGIPDNWNAPVAGERVGVCLTPADQSSRATVTVSGSSVRVPWSWERSANGDEWTAIPGTGDGSSLPTYEYSPVAADVGMYIRAKVELADGSVAYTRALGGRVSATTTAAEGAEIPFVRGHAAPQVDAEIVASNPLPTGAKDARVGWQRCPSTTTAPHSDCTAILAEPGHWWIRYTPTADDVGFYLRMYAYYETGDGTWTRRVTPITSAVVASQ